MGLTAAIATVPVSSFLYSFEIPVLIAATIALFFVAGTGMRIVRWEGAVLVALFVAVQGVVLMRGLA